MSNTEHIKNYICNPLPLWDVQIANLVTDYKWSSSLENIFPNREDYSIAGCVLKDAGQKEEAYFLLGINDKIRLVLPTDVLSDFYEKHGLKPSRSGMSLIEKIQRVKSAMDMISEIPSLSSFILHLVKSMQIIEAENPETDISYSHPDIPFSIFFSLCEQVSIISDLRVAESIIHESMHLLLSLVENHSDLIIPGSNTTFYSPWRGEHRPIRGVLHGMFVFKAIKEFYNILLTEGIIKSSCEKEYINLRVQEIETEMRLLTDFPELVGLTSLGRELSIKLLGI